MKGVWSNRRAPSPGKTSGRGPENVVYGHIVHSRRNPRIDTRETSHGVVRCYGIDTGCVFGGRLTAIVFDDEEMRAEPTFVQVEAERAYVALPAVVPDEVSTD